MNEQEQSFSKFDFVKAVLLPGLLIFLIPVIGLVFFLHAQSQFDARARKSILNEIRADRSLPDEQREAAIRLYTEVPFSRMLENEQFAAGVNDGVRFDYATFRWMIRLSAWSIAGGIAIVLLAGVCVLASLRSQLAQYLSLLVGWHVLRVYAALQTVIQGVLLVALSFWVTALWMEFYSVKLIGLTGLVALIAMGIVLTAIFRRPDMTFAVEGHVIPQSHEMPLWDELQAICTRAGTAPPDQVIAGIDDNFFVTEHPVTVGDQTYHGRSLFVSLPLLKQLDGNEADAVLAHEMAHFSGNDTLYSRRIGPLLTKYDHYLAALHEGFITLPMFFFMQGFRAVFQLSLGRLSRQREFRADRLALEATSPQSIAGALLRIAAYSTYRGTVEESLFKQEQALETAEISRQVESGFPGYAAGFLATGEIGSMQTAHPFDSHPPLAARLEPSGLSLDSPETARLLERPGDGRWYHCIDGAEEIETAQWQGFEEQFRQMHAASLPYRFLPETDEERAIVSAAFPEAQFEGKKGTVEITCESICHTAWEGPVRWQEVFHIEVNDSDVLQVQYERNGMRTATIALKPLTAVRQNLLETLGQYYGRHQAAVEYQQFKREQEEAEQHAARM